MTTQQERTRALPTMPLEAPCPDTMDLSYWQAEAILQNNRAIEKFRKGQYRYAVTDLSAALFKQKKAMKIAWHLAPSLRENGISSSAPQSSATGVDPGYSSSSPEHNTAGCRGSDEDGADAVDGHPIVKLDQCMLASRKKFASTSQDLKSKKKNTAGEEVVIEEQAAKFVYDSPIAIPPMKSPYHHSQRAGTITIAAIILFNLALTHHMYAESMFQPNERRRPDKEQEQLLMLVKAAKVYKLAHQLQNESKLGGNILFSMATLNNLVVIYRDVGDHDMSKRYSDKLLSLIMHVVVNEGGRGGDDNDSSLQPVGYPHHQHEQPRLTPSILSSSRGRSEFAYLLDHFLLNTAICDSSMATTRNSPERGRGQTGDKQSTRIITRRKKIKTPPLFAAPVA